ncbi:MAG: hypothetical protein IPH45_12810 [Bacteroidales bacterium]|nr:hypothetical protein [Bacteroidales bacterium]
MKRLFIILGVTFLTIIMFVIVYYLFLTDFGRKDILSTEPRKPVIEVPVTYNIGWWNDQKAFKVDSLKIDIVESRLNLFNSKSLISYKVIGHLENKGYFINEVHISERINLDTTLNCDRVVEITPVIKDKRITKVNNETNKFEFKNEHIINSNHWGINRIKFICGLKEQTIELHQIK